MKTLIFQEIIIHNRIYNLFKYSLMFFTFCILSVTMISSYENIQNFGIIFSVITIPLAFLSLSSNLIKSDIEDGTMEMLLTSRSALQIILAKYISLCLCVIFSFLLLSPIIYLVYDIELSLFAIIILCALMLILLSSAIITIIASMQGYFRSNTNFLSVLIMPLIIPSIILSGILIQSPFDTHYLFIMLGINLVIIPPVLYLSAYLIDNIYNI
jgi:heme exporter protein B